MAREFVGSAGGFTLTNNPASLWFLNPIASPSANLEVLRMWGSQSGTATSAQQRVQLATQVTAFPTLTATTPRALKKGDTTISVIVGSTSGAAGTFGTNASTEGAGAKTTNWDDNFNNLNGYLWVPTPRETLVLPTGFASGLNLFLPAAPGTLTNWAAGVNFAEV